MKLFIFVVLAVMLVATTALAAEVPTSRGDKAMIFMFSGLDDLGLDGVGQVGFGGRYYIADGTAIRGVVEFGKGKLDWTGDDLEGNVISYGLTAVYEKHMPGPCSSISPYWGLGAGFTASSAKLEDTDTNDWIEERENAFRLFGALGFEWGFASCMTLGGEYQLGYESLSGETEEEFGGVSDTYDEFDGSFMGFGTASLFLSVYW